MLYTTERQRLFFDRELITVKCSFKTSVSLVLRKCSHKSDVVIVTSFTRKSLHTWLCPFGVRIRQVRLLYLNSPNYSSLLHADQCKHYNTTVVISVGVITCVFPYTIQGPYIYFFAREDFILSCFLAFHDSARSFLLLSRFRPRDVLQGIFVFLLLMHTYARGFKCIRTNTCSEMRKQNIHAS